jgi:hypothetical protein
MNAGITAEIARLRATTVVLHNSRIVCWLTMTMGPVAVFVGLCMIVMVCTLVFPLSAITWIRGLAATQWGMGAVGMFTMCPWVWQWGTRMLSFNVKLDARGVDFNLGTKKKPNEMFMAWDQVAAVEQKRLGNAWEFIVLGKDGSRASYSSYTFFRPKRVARMIADRAGLTIQKG